MNELEFYQVQKKINFGFDQFPFNNNVHYLPAPTEVDYEEFEKELRRLIRLTKEEKKFENFHCLFVFGPTGVGKTAIPKIIAEEEGCVYHKLEVQKVPLEEIAGFPYLQDRQEKKVVKLAEPTILPPSGHDGVWILHLDEFNKADTEKMAAIMNLALSGEIGGSADFDEKTGKSTKYKLPAKTIIIGTGNFRSQDNIENLNMVNAMDTATSERFHRTVFLKYNAKSWLKNFAIKEYQFRIKDQWYKLDSRIPPIILNFVMSKMLEQGNEAPFTIQVVTKPGEGGGERTTSPRAWTIVGDNMILDALSAFEKLGEERSEYERISEKLFGNPYRAFDIFFQNPYNQIEFFSKNTPEFGLKGREIIQEVIESYIHFAKNRIVPEDILLNYAKNRDRVKELKSKIGFILYLLISIGNHIAMLDKMDPKDIRIGTINISTFLEDMDIQVEDIAVFIHLLVKSKSEVAKIFNDTLYATNERYKSSFTDFYYINGAEIRRKTNAET